MTDAPQILLEHRLKKLKPPMFWSEHGKLARQCAAEDEPVRRHWFKPTGEDHVQYLLRLCEMELIERERRMIERRKVPSNKKPPLSGSCYA